MGADYFIYTEIKSEKDDQWKLLNGKFFCERENTFKITPTYVNGSRSYFSRTYEFLETIGCPIDLQKISKDIVDAESWLAEDGGAIFYVYLSDLKKSIEKLKNRKECCGYVHKSLLWEHLANGTEIDEYLSGTEYKKLAPAERNEYEFYEWDDDMNWPVHIKHIISLIEAQISFYSEINYSDVSDGDVRIICFVSY